MLTLRSLQVAIEEAERFLRHAKTLEGSFIAAELQVDEPADEDTPIVAFPLQSGAVRRSSMDLSRALAEMRARPSRSKA